MEDPRSTINPGAMRQGDTIAPRGRRHDDRSMRHLWHRVVSALTQALASDASVWFDRRPGRREPGPVGGPRESGGLGLGGVRARGPAVVWGRSSAVWGRSSAVNAPPSTPWPWLIPLPVDHPRFSLFDWDESSSSLKLSCHR